MTGDLISREALMQFPIRLNHFDEVNGDVKYVFGVEDVLEYAQNLPAIDAVPVVHGRWEICGNGMTCLVCHKGLVVEEGDADMNYCPNCGAKMDEEEADG